MKQEHRFQSLMAAHPSLMRDLRIIETLNLSSWCIAAGYVRNYIWDKLHHYTQLTPLNDVDVLYYDLSDINESSEKKHEDYLKKHYPEYKWSVKNQARMHLRMNEPQYPSIEDAMIRWPETATAIGVTLDTKRELVMIAPHGLEDLFNLVVRKSQYFKDQDYFIRRINEKGWEKHWPKLKIMNE